MDFRNTNSTPSQATPQAAPQATPARATGGGGASSGGRANKPNLGLMVAGVVLLVALVAAGLWWALSGNSGSGSSAINRDAHQAVFLTNGQVYFGELTSVSGKYAVMENVYYLQVEQAVQPSTENPADAAGTDADNNVQLIKLGNELHGPEDEMHISTQQVLFWENLKEDSRISQAITEYTD